MIADVHTHVGVDMNGPFQHQTMAELKRKMLRYGIDKSVVFPFSEPNLVESSLKLARHRSESIIPFLRFDPNKMQSMKLRQLLKGNAFSGVKLHTRAQVFDPLNKKFIPLYREIADSGKPLIIHTRLEKNPNSDPERVMLLGDLVPGMTLILAHFAGISIKAFDYAKAHKNVYIETSALSTDYLIKMIVERIGADKLIFGSDSPLSDQEIEIMKISKAKISSAQRERIFHRNLAKIIDL